MGQPCNSSCRQHQVGDTLLERAAQRQGPLCIARQLSSSNYALHLIAAMHNVQRSLSAADMRSPGPAS